MNWLFTQIDFFINKDLLKEEDLSIFLKARFLVLMTISALLILPFPMILEFKRFGVHSFINVINILTLFGFVLTLVSLKRSSNQHLHAFLFFLTSLSTIFLTAIISDGIYDSTFVWLSLGPFAATLLSGTRLSIGIGSFSIVGLISIYFLQVNNYLPHIRTSVRQDDFFKLVTVIAPILFSGLMGSLFEKLLLNTKQKLLKVKEELLSQKQKLFQSQKLASIGEFANGIAHEINNPLAILKFLSKNLETKLSKNDTMDFEIQQIIKKMNATIERTVSIINALQVFSQSGIKQNFKEKNLLITIKSSFMLCESKFLQQGITMKLETLNETLLIQHDESLILQVLVHLYYNSYDAIKDKPKKWIHVKIIDKEQQVIIKVIDSGDGIKQTQQDKIMQPFYSTKDIGEGTGLGLSICHGIMKQHQGSLVYNPLSKNTEFEITFPKSQESKKQAS